MREEKSRDSCENQGRWYLLMSHRISHLNMKCDCGGTKEGLRKKGMFVGILGEGRHTIRDKEKGLTHQKRKGCEIPT
jgi:hypothetical protein